MIQLERTSNGNAHWLYDSQLFTQVSSDLFKAGYWQAKNAITGQESGRGTTWFIRHQEHELVLRHYLRGGLMQKLSRDSYVYNRLDNCRSMSEFTILSELHQQGFPVPKPAAAQVIKKGLFYQADLLTHKIPHAHDLVQILKTKQNENFYASLGKVIAKLHQHGVYHADLNIQNILQDKTGSFWIIDFDRAKLLTPNPTWQDSNLKRLKRSFEKEKLRFNIQWQASDWLIFHDAYQQEV